MKKFIKVFIIVLLVIAAAAVTCYFFYKNLYKDKKKEVSIIEFSQSVEKQNFITKLTLTNSNIISTENSDSRFNVVIEVVDNLNNALEILSTYFINSDYIIKDEELANVVTRAKNLINLGSQMIDEYEKKATYDTTDDDKENYNIYFNRNLGANDLYSTSAEFIVAYSNVINLVKNKVEVNKNVDARFALIDAYTTVCANTFSKVIKNASNWNVIETEDNISAFNTLISGKGLQFAPSFDENSVNFISYFNKCNKTTFAKNLHSNLISNPKTTDEQLATFYLSEIYK